MGQFSRLLRRYRQSRGLPKSRLAEKIGVSPVTYHYWETGKYKPPPPHRLRAICDALRLTKAERARLLDLAARERLNPEALAYVRSLQAGRNHDTPQPLRTRAVPLYGRIPAGKPEPVEAVAETFDVLEHLARPDRYVLRVQGDSMDPTIRDEDLILVQYVEAPDLARCDNQVCVVLLDGDSTLKRVQVQRVNGHTIIILKGDRPEHPTETFVLGTRDFKIQGIVLRIVDRAL